MPSPTQKKILITSPRFFIALQLARQLNSNGHQIFTADSMNYHISRFSNAIHKNYCVPSPTLDLPGYFKSILNIVKTEKIDVIIPIFEEVAYLSKLSHLLPKTCTLFAPSFELYNELQNKWLFQCKLEKLGFDVLKKDLLSSKADLKNFSFDTPFALKACYSRASLKVKKVYPNDSLSDLLFEPHNPWLVQEWMNGNRFCTYGICHEGHLAAHTVYPVHYAIEGNNCITFESVEHPAILEWVKHFVKESNYTGQIAFDFIEAPNKKIYAIECNPRATNGILLFNKKDRLDLVFLEKNQQLIEPQKNRRRQLGFGMLMYGWKKDSLPNNTWMQFLKDFCTTRDVVFNPRDLKPLLFSPLVFTSLYIKGLKQGLPMLDIFIQDHGWNGEPINEELIKDL